MVFQGQSLYRGQIEIRIRINVNVCCEIRTINLVTRSSQRTKKNAFVCYGIKWFQNFHDFTYFP